MSRIVAPKRGPKAAKRADLSDLRELFRDGRCECQMGVVRQAELGGKHWELTDDGDILVEVTTAPRGLELSCRLASSAGSAGMGLWRVPAIGDEVLVLVPEGEIEYQPAIVAVLSSGGIPDRVSDTRTILVATDEVEVTAPKVTLGPKPGEDTGCAVFTENEIKLGGESATQKVPKGDAQATALKAFASALNTYAGAIQGIADPSSAATGVLTTAINAFKTQVDAALSAVTKTL